MSDQRTEDFAAEAYAALTISKFHVKNESGLRAIDATLSMAPLPVMVKGASLVLEALAESERRKSAGS